MQFRAKQDIEAPIDFVFGQVSDFHAFERSAMRRGAEVQRVDSLGKPGVGMAWDAAFDLRGKRREIKMQLASFDPPNGLSLTSRAASMGGDFVVELVALSRGRTRMDVSLTLEPRNLSARLLVQSLKLARSNLKRRFEARLANFARDVEERYKLRARA
jgi:hypothetical protein